MSDKELLEEIFKKLGGNFICSNDNSAVTKSEVASNAFIETLFNIGLYEKVDKKEVINENGSKEFIFTIKKLPWE